MRTRIVLIAGLAAIVLGSTVVAGADTSGPVEVVASFDASQGHLPEGVALDKSGNIYASLGPPFFVGGGYGEIRRIGKDGTEETLVLYPDGPAPAGLAVDPAGNVFYTVPDVTGSDVGVYRVTDTGGERFTGTEQMLVPNGLAIDKHGSLFASDSILGSIWRMPTGGSATAEPWLSHDLLAGCAEDPLGANGIAFWKGDLFVANTAKGLLARVPIGNDGAPGTPEIVAGDTDCDPTDDLYGMDGIAFDVHGQLYALLVLQHKLVRIDPTDGGVELLLDEDDGLWNGASIAFGTGNGDRHSLFISNYAVLPPEPTNSLGPAILKVDAGMPGLPLP
jgi:sugar lactone lactonase YvrE